MSDIGVLKAFCHRDMYLKYSGIMYKLRNLQKETKMVLHSIRSYYETYRDRDTMTVSELREFFKYENPQVGEDNMIINRIFTQLESTEISNEDLLTDILNGVVERHVMTQVSEISGEMVQNQRKSCADEVTHLLSDYHNLVGQIKDVEMEVCNDSLTELLNDDKPEGLSWRLNFLNDTFGPPKTSTLGHIFGRPDSGKSSLAISELCNFAYQLKDTDKTLLYLNNEENIKRVKLRAICCFVKKNQDYLASHISDVEQRWNELGGNRIKFIGGVKELSQVEKYLTSFEPRIVIIDQGPKVTAPMRKNSNEVEHLKRLYNAFREMATDYNTTIITLGQADNAAENRKYLYLNNLDSSKVAIPGELDFCLGIGKVNDMANASMRYLNVCKNKMTGASGNTTVSFDVPTGRFED